MSQIPTPLIAKGAAQVAKSAKFGDSKIFEAAKKFGKVDKEGNVYLLQNGKEKYIAQYVGGDLADALNIFIDRYIELSDLINDFEFRLKHSKISEDELTKNLARLRKPLEDPQFIGDVDLLNQKISTIEEEAAAWQEQYAKEYNSVLEQTIQAKEKIISKIEEFSSKDIGRSQYKQATQRVQELFDQIVGNTDLASLPRKVQEQLKDRAFAARRSFDSQRRNFFKNLDDLNSEVKIKKQNIISQAENLTKQLSSITENTGWDETAKKFKDLMGDWKHAGRAKQKDDDELWAQFKHYQDLFFSEKEKIDNEMSVVYDANLIEKNKLLDEANKIDLKEAKFARSKFRDVQKKWDAVGRVSREDTKVIEAKLSAIDEKIKKLEESEWKNTNTALLDRANSLVTQANEAIAKLEIKIKESKDSGTIKKLSDELESKKSLLKMLNQ